MGLIAILPTGKSPSKLQPSVSLHFYKLYVLGEGEKKKTTKNIAISFLPAAAELFPKAKQGQAVWSHSDLRRPALPWRGSDSFSWCRKSACCACSDLLLAQMDNLLLLHSLHTRLAEGTEVSNPNFQPEDTLFYCSAELQYCFPAVFCSLLQIQSDPNWTEVYSNLTFLSSLRNRVQGGPVSDATG